LPADGWRLDGTFGFIDPKYQTYYASIPDPNIAQTDGIKFSNLPTTTASADAQYSFARTSVGDPIVRLDWNHTSRRYTSNNPVTLPYFLQGSAPPFDNVGAEITLANIPLNIHGVTIDAEAYGKNLLGHHDVLISSDVISGLGFANEQWGPGRQFGLMLTGRF
jgi:iron complex outermembrane recepter protein